MSHDGLIIGAGHHGLILGAYLARAGLKVAILERRGIYGGGLETSQPGPAGFSQNLHSVNHFDVTGTPWYRDLGLRVEYVTPRHDFAQPHEDGTALIFSRDVDETCASIARFSTRDAARFRELHAEALRLCRDERFGAPVRTPSPYFERPPLELVDELFEDERVKRLLAFKVSLFGVVLRDVVSTPGGAFLRAFDLRRGYQVCVGGSFNLARGLMRAFEDAGGTYYDHAHAERIVVEGGRATGVELADGRVLRSEFVASTIDVEQTYGALLGLAVPAYAHTPTSVFGIHLALREPPRYTASAFNPHLDRALKYFIGGEFAAGHVTTFDPSQAPPGRASAFAWHAVSGEFDADAMAAHMIETWRAYAPNLDVLHCTVRTPQDYSRELINMVGGDIFMGSLAGERMPYRTPVPGVYMAGSPTHPGGAITGGGGYNAAGVIVRDLGLDPWWPPVGLVEAGR